MRKEDRYMLREKGIPYSYDEPVTETPDVRTGVMPGVSLRMYEIFDGKEVKWGIREDYISIYFDRVCKSTPLFENMTDEFGKDKERIIYLGNSKFLYHGMINGSEVLCKINDSLTDDDFYTIENFTGKGVKFTEKDKNTALVKFIDNGLNKYMYFKYREFRPCSNVFDYVDDKNFFIKSYVVDNKLRVFMGKINDDGTEVKPYGYDMNRREYINFPLDEDGLIDEDEMYDYVKTDAHLYGENISNYRYIQDNITSFLMDLGLYGLEARLGIEALNSERNKTK